MISPSLTPSELDLITGVFRNHAEITAAKLYGSRAKGTNSANSDVDLALWGDLDEIRAESIAAELDELPLPYHFDVTSFDQIKLDSLREHIERVGIVVYP